MGKFGEEVSDAVFMFAQAQAATVGATSMDGIVATLMATAGVSMMMVTLGQAQGGFFCEDSEEARFRMLNLAASVLVEIVRQSTKRPTP